MASTERVFLVHGWSVQETSTYQALHLKLAESGFSLQQIYLGRYVSLDDEVRVEDLSLALHRELLRQLGPVPWKGRFHFITHSTGALVVKDWVRTHYEGAVARHAPLANVVFLAGPHFGSRLAHHGRSMLAHAAYVGDTGRRILEALELGSSFAWESNLAWMEADAWRDRGIRPSCITGDRVVRNAFKARILPAAYEPGSDMVVRVASANLNFCHHVCHGGTGELQRVGGLTGIPFAALQDFTHSGPRHGIMNSVTTATPRQGGAGLHLRLMVQALKVASAADERRLTAAFARQTAATREQRPPFAQIDLRFRDERGAPITDYSFVLGHVRRGRRRASETIVHTHRNEEDGSRFTVFFDLRKLKSEENFFMEFRAASDTELVSYDASRLERVEMSGARVRDLVCPDRTTLMDVVVPRRPAASLFVFHAGDDPDLHVRWDRRGRITRKGGKTR